MTDPTQASTDVDPIVLPRDPPAPPGYVDPVEGSPRLQDASTAEPEASDASSARVETPQNGSGEVAATAEPPAPTETSTKAPPQGTARGVP